MTPTILYARVKATNDQYVLRKSTLNNMKIIDTASILEVGTKHLI